MRDGLLLMEQVERTARRALGDDDPFTRSVAEALVRARSADDPRPEAAGEAP